MSKPIPLKDLEHVLNHTRQLWEDVRGRRIFVSGGTGFFGCWLLESFAFANKQLNLGASLVTLTRDPDAFRLKAAHLAANPAIVLHKGDVRDFSFPSGEFSHIIHAATASCSPVASLQMLDTIIAGTRRVLDFSVACRAEKLLFASSGAVYGPQPPDITHMPETYGGAPGLADPNADYGEGKRVAELLCAIYQNNHGLKSKIARCFAQIGPHLPLDIHFAVGNFIRDVIAGGPIRVSGDGTPYRSYLYTADLAIWLWTILINGKSCWPYNVGSEEALTIKEVAQTVADVLASGMPITVNGVSDPAQKPTRYVPDTKRAQMDLGLRQTVGLREAISKTAAWNMQ